MFERLTKFLSQSNINVNEFEYEVYKFIDENKEFDLYHYQDRMKKIFGTCQKVQDLDLKKLSSFDVLNLLTYVVRCDHMAGDSEYLEELIRDSTINDWLLILYKQDNAPLFKLKMEGKMNYVDYDGISKSEYNETIYSRGFIIYLPNINDFYFYVDFVGGENGKAGIKVSGPHLINKEEKKNYYFKTQSFTLFLDEPTNIEFGFNHIPTLEEVDFKGTMTLVSMSNNY